MIMPPEMTKKYDCMLEHLFDGLNVEIKDPKGTRISGLCKNSKSIQVGDLFIATRGACFNGVDFILEAVYNGAVAVMICFDPIDGTNEAQKMDSVSLGKYFDNTKSSHVTNSRQSFVHSVFSHGDKTENDLSIESVYNNYALPESIALILCYNQDVEAVVIDRFYRNPTHNLFVIGVTGTNGKSTTSCMTQHLLGTDKCGLLGTMGKYGQEYDIRTTADLVTNHKTMRKLVDCGKESAVMEVTSHGLTQGRVDGLDFNVAIFTNLSPEHLDYHGTMEKYIEAKKNMFTFVNESNKYAIINADDPLSHVMIKNSHANIITIGIDNPADFRASRILCSLSNTEFLLKFQDEEYDVSLSMLGKHNVYNALSAIAASYTRGIGLKTLIQRLSQFPGVPGRLETIENPLQIYVFIDYAHTNFALENVLSQLNELKPRNLITVFNCGGDRYRGKRPEMARTAEKYSDYVVVTQANIRSEDPDKIFDDISRGFVDVSKVLFEHNRGVGIEKGIHLAHPRDIVVVCGHGSEQFLDNAGVLTDFDDRTIAEQILLEMVINKERTTSSDDQSIK